jgi:toxin ParE1/3/4
MRLLLADTAKNDLADVWAFYERLKNSDYAQKIVDAMLLEARVLEDFPLMGRPRNDLGEGLRALVINKYIFFYITNGDDVLIKCVIHGHRDIDAQFGD